MTITAERQDDMYDWEPELSLHTCFWCKKPFAKGEPVHHAHVGGHGMVEGCSSCLGLNPADSIN